MTGFKSERLRHECAKAGCYIDKLPCWDDLIKVFPRNICPMDIDGAVEMNGHLLFLEEKRAGAALYQPGQGDLLRMLASKPGITVVTFRPSQELGHRDVIVNETGGPQPVITVTEEQFFAWLRRWVMRAEAGAA